MTQHPDPSHWLYTPPNLPPPDPQEPPPEVQAEWEEPEETLTDEVQETELAEWETVFHSRLYAEAVAKEAKQYVKPIDPYGEPYPDSWIDAFGDDPDVLNDIFWNID
jgi:hypothetical protein